MLADAFPERAFAVAPNPRRRAGVAVAVALLHLILLYGLLHAVNIRALPKAVIERTITIWLPPKPPKAEPKKEKETQPLPSLEAPTVREPRTAPITVVPLPARPKPSDEDGMKKLGRYLENCSAGNYAALTQQEWANCLGGIGTKDPNTVRLGDVHTLWEAQHPAKAPANPNDATGFGECAHNDPKRLMGLPCFQHDGQKPSVLNGQQ
jgi:hypothetical protein